jgi:Cof subfamily protein (haloacid dehalogenase superfamily)
MRSLRCAAAPRIWATLAPNPPPRPPATPPLALKYKLLALDLDGTILDLQLNLDPRDLEALTRIVRAGVTVIACTGRPFPGAVPWVERLGLKGPIVCYQGAEVRALDGAVLLDHGVAHDLAMEVIDYARKRDLHVQAYRDDKLIVERDRPEAHRYAQHAGMAIHLVPDLDTGMGPTTPKLVIVSTPEVLEAILPEARTRWKGRLNVATSTPDYLEFTSVDSDKASALRFLCERLGVAQAETVAVGDGRNDASMIKWAGLGLAIEGSPPEVIEAADRTIPGPGHSGIQQLADALLV